MNKVKAWFKKTFMPVDDFADMRAEMAMVLEVCNIIDSDKPDLEKLYKLLSRITLIDFVWVDQLLTPMELACAKGDPWCVAALIANGADIHGAQRNKNKVISRPIHHACLARPGPRQLDCVRMLIQKGADFKEPDENGNTPIQQAASKGNLEVVRLLLKLGVDVDCTGPDNRSTPLVQVCYIPSREELRKYILEKDDEEDGTEQRPTEAQDESPLSAQGQAQAQPQDQVQDQTRVQAEDQDQTQAQDQVQDQDQAQAQEAQKEREGGGDDDVLYDLVPKATIYKLMRLLLENGANVNKLIQCLTDALSIAARLLFVERVFILLSYGADVNNPRCPKHQCILKAVLEASSEKGVQRETFFKTLSLLLAAGARITLESLENEIRPVLDSRPQLGAVRHAVFDLLQHYAAAPAPLKMLCRRRIRGLLPPDIDANIKLIPLPDVLRNFLRFKDIVP